MAKAVLICGKICSGKSHYAKLLKKDIHAVVLSCDELMLRIFPADLGEGYDAVAEKARQYLFDLSLGIVEAGTNVILDFGFWSRKDRSAASEFYRVHGVPVEWHYVDVSEEDWKRNIQDRNDAVRTGKSAGYFVDEGLLVKLNSMFEAPSREEMDHWYTSERSGSQAR